MDRDPDRMDYEPNAEDERIEPLEPDDELAPPPPTLDPDERIEALDDDAPAFDDDRTA